MAEMSEPSSVRIKLARLPTRSPTRRPQSAAVSTDELDVAVDTPGRLPLQLSRLLTRMTSTRGLDAGDTSRPVVPKDRFHGSSCALSCLITLIAAILIWSLGMVYSAAVRELVGLVPETCAIASSTRPLAAGAFEPLPISCAHDFQYDSYVRAGHKGGGGVTGQGVCIHVSVSYTVAGVWQPTPATAAFGTLWALDKSGDTKDIGVAYGISREDFGILLGTEHGNQSELPRADEIRAYMADVKHTLISDPGYATKFGGCSLMDCRLEGREAVNASATLLELLPVGREFPCYTRRFASSDDMAVAMRGVPRSAPGELMPVVLRRELSLDFDEQTTVVALWLATFISCCCCCTFLLCREWWCQWPRTSWTLRAQHF